LRDRRRGTNRDFNQKLFGLYRRIRAEILKFELMRELFCREREERAAAASAQHEENKAVSSSVSGDAWEMWHKTIPFD
jgi:hypothetical protein